MCRSSIPFGAALPAPLPGRRASLMLMLFLCSLHFPAQAEDPVTVDEVFQRVRQHNFHPLNEQGTFTIDHELKKHGVANLGDQDWRVRLSAIRDCVRALPAASGEVLRGLRDDNLHVRQIAAASLGIARVTTSRDALENLLQTDESPLVRCQAAMSLGQMESESSLVLLEKLHDEDPSRDVRHQCELAIGQISNKLGATEELLQAYRDLNPEDFGRVHAGDKASEFVLSDTKGIPWKLSEANQKGWVVLIWIFADWCPVCHGEFRDLINMQKEFQEAGVQIATIECHDTFRGRRSKVRSPKETKGHDFDLTTEADGPCCGPDGCC